MQQHVMTPWAGVGIDIEQGETIESVLTRGKLRYVVEKVPMQIEGQIVPGVHAVVRAEDKHFYSVAGENYSVTQPEAAFRFFAEFIGDRGQMTAAGKFREGEFAWLLARCEQGFDLAGDRINGYLLFTMPYQVGIGMSVQLVMIRESTKVTLPLVLSAKRKGLKLVRHAKQEAIASDSEQIFTKAGQEIEEFGKMAQVASTLPIDKDELDAFFHRAFGLEPADEAWREHKLIRMSHHGFVSAPGQQHPSCAGTWWGALMAVTYVIDYQSGNSPDTRLYNAWHGWTASVKSRALEAVKEQVASHLARTGSPAADRSITHKATGSVKRRKAA